MSETTIEADVPAAEEPAPPVAEVPQEVETATETGPDLAAEVAKWKALSKKNETRAKENADKARRLDEIEEANKTELQKLLERAEKAEKALEAKDVEILRGRTSAKTGVPVELIHGNTEEEMQAAAEIALAFKGKTSPAPPAQIVTAPADSTQVKSLTRADLKDMTPAEVLAAYKEGRLDAEMGRTK